MASFGTYIVTKLLGERVGEDDFGNIYYTCSFRLLQAPGSLTREKRWVIYKGFDEASKVPPLWHAWLHHNLDEPPLNSGTPYVWQKQHKPNLTGTPGAYLPEGHTLKSGKRAKAVGDYLSWVPSTVVKKKD
jgi:NADH:ubiquinone oxidoreductase subunit